MSDTSESSTRREARSATTHDLGDVWQEVRKHGETVARLHIENRSLADALTDIRDEVRSELREIRTIISRPQQPVNWVGIGSLAIAVLIAGGTYANSVLAPVNQKTEQNWNWIRTRTEAMVAESKSYGITETNAAFAVNHILSAEDHLLGIQARISRLEGRMTAEENLD